MKFSEALQYISENGGMITRDKWDYVLYFNREGILILDDSKQELCAYSVSNYDFNYEWKIKE